MSKAAYAKKLVREGARSKATVVAAQDIGAMPPVQNPLRRAKADADFRFFCESYFPQLFTLAWSPDHLKIIAKIESAVTHGGQFAMAMPRGSGKTTLCQVAVLWALLTGRQQFVFLIAATADYASAALTNLKNHLSQNDLLLEDYPEAVYPIRCLEGESRRCLGQRYYGRRTRIGWTSDEIILPTIPGSRCSGAIVRTAGITGNVRGAMHVRHDGKSVRPTLVIIDDPQTDESARSLSQVHERLAVVNGAILNLAGPGKRIAVVMPCTVIRKDDLADRLLDRSKHPDWQGERTKMVYAFPTDEQRWAEYAKIRETSHNKDNDGAEATEFYRQNREAMDLGAVVAWPERHEPQELSAIQHAMNLRLRNEAAFWAEYQNEPQQADGPVDLLLPTEIAARCAGFARGTVAPDCEKLTAFIDVGQHVLWWMVCGWDEAFGGYISDYGCWPEQSQRFFIARNANPTLRKVYGNKGGAEATIYAGLGDLVAKLAGATRTRADGATIPLGRIFIDSGWSRDTVRLFVRQSPYRQMLLPTKGVGIGPANTAIADYPRRPGERRGEGWILGAGGSDGLRLLRFDSNLWKSKLADALTRPMGARGGIVLFGDKPAEHELLATHLAAEYPTRTEAKGNAVDVWTRRPDRDNHWLDCLVGCAVAASLEGISGIARVVKAKPAPRSERKVWKAGKVWGHGTR